MRIAGITIPDNKRIEFALPYIFGIGFSRARAIVREAHIDPTKRAKDLDPAEVNRIKGIIEGKFKVEGELRQIIRQHIQLLKELKTYRGMRHLRRLPVHGQRTKTNSRTVRGNVRKTAGSGRRKVELK